MVSPQLVLLTKRDYSKNVPSQFPLIILTSLGVLDETSIGLLMVTKTAREWRLKLHVLLREVTPLRFMYYARYMAAAAMFSPRFNFDLG